MLTRGLAFLVSLAAVGQVAPHDTTVVVFVSAVCPISTSYSGRLNDLYREYSPKGVKFLFLNANQNEPETTIYPFPVQKDAGAVMADRLGAQMTPEAFVMGPGNKIRYRGRIDDSQNPARVKQSSLRQAIDAVLAGREVVAPETKAFGCTIKRARQSLSALDESSYRTLIQAQAGNVALVDFWATWCAPCRKEIPLLASLADRLSDKRFRLITISADDTEAEKAAVQFLQKSGISGPAYIRRAKDDDAFIRAVDPKWSGALPALFLYDRGGKLVKSSVGETDLVALEATIRKLL